MSDRLQKILQGHFSAGFKMSELGGCPRYCEFSERILGPILELKMGKGAMFFERGVSIGREGAKRLKAKLDLCKPFQVPHYMQLCAPLWPAPSRRLRGGHIGPPLQRVG